MNKIITAIIIGLFAAQLTAQVKNISARQNFKQFDWEVSTSFSLGTSRSTVESSAEHYSGSGDNSLYIEISATVGFFVMDGLSIEPELSYNLFSDDGGLALIANLCYTLSIPGKKIYPFFKIGYGKSSYSGYYNYSEDSEGMFESLHSNVFSAGAGLKIIQSSSLAMRLELNYKNISSSSSINYYYPYTESHKIDTNISIIEIRIGASFLL